MLTAKAVIDKRFQGTKFREGYDQDEVDDFLDEVAQAFHDHTSRSARLEEHNAKLEKRNAELEEHNAKLEKEKAELIRENHKLKVCLREHAALEPESGTVTVEETTVEETVIEETVVTAGKEVGATAGPSEAGTAGAKGSTIGLAGNATGLLAMAQKLHDEHVSDGQRRRDELIREGQEQATQKVAEAERRSRDLIGKAKAECQDLERRIAELRVFEHKYREGLRNYLGSLLHSLDKNNTMAEPRVPEINSSHA